MKILSITIITYNQENFIRNTLDSVLSQDVDFEYEVIIGDDASTDATPKIIQEYTNKFPNIIKPIFRGKNIGHTANYIETTKLCSGKYVAHIDGDDLMLPGKLKKQVDYLNTHPNCSIVHHPVYLIDIDGKTIKKSNASESTVGTINDLIIKDRIINSSNMFRHSSLDENFYNMKKDLLLHDWLAHLIKAQYGTINVIPEFLGSYRVYDQSIIVSSSFLKQCKSILYTLNHAKTFKGVDISSYNKGIGIIYFNMCRHFFKNHAYKRSEYFLKKSCSHRLYSWDNFRYYIKLKLKNII